jgi:hypothetical protein
MTLSTSSTLHLQLLSTPDPLIHADVCLWATKSLELSLEGVEDSENSIQLLKSLDKAEGGHMLYQAVGVLKSFCQVDFAQRRGEYGFDNCFHGGWAGSSWRYGSGVFEPFGDGLVERGHVWWW